LILNDMKFGGFWSYLGYVMVNRMKQSS
jgi:hypothetical protein